MQYFAYSAAVWLILIMCGLPLAFVLLPANLRRLSLPMAPVFGYSYIAFVGYFFYRSNVGGTNFYAPFLLGPPIVGLLLLIWRCRVPAAMIFGRQAMLMVALTVLGFLFLSSVFMLAGGRAVSMAGSRALEGLPLAQAKARALAKAAPAKIKQRGWLGDLTARSPPASRMEKGLFTEPP